MGSVGVISSPWHGQTCSSSQFLSQFWLSPRPQASGKNGLPSSPAMARDTPPRRILSGSTFGQPTRRWWTPTMLSSRLESTYWMAIYEHSDWTQEEFEERMLGAKVPEDMSAIPVGDFEPLPNAPSHLDYREEGKVTPVKNQGQCGSCWAFSATGALEGMWKQNRGELISMSEQQGVDCGQGSCNGGWMYWFWETVRNGIESEATYPYTARDGSCHANSNNFVATNSGDRRVSQSESALESALVGAEHQSPSPSM